MENHTEHACGCGEGKTPDRHGRCMMPEVTFSAFILSLNTSALFHMGEIPDPTTGQKTLDFDLAKNAIDTLVMLERKTKGNLSRDEEELLKSIVYDCKIRFVKAVKS
ncbi:MAG: DUF1844 domain-containing protein [Desulfobulbaceae bacterium]|nr:DUF1844 domain-containing protein [Desulfobulbaceae bacterium]